MTKNPPKSKRSNKVLNLVDNIIARVEEKVATGNCIEILGVVMVLQKVATIIRNLNDLEGEEKEVVEKELSQEDKDIINRYIKKVGGQGDGND